MATVLGWLCLLGAVCGSLAHKPLKSWKLCPRSDPDVQGCLRTAIQGAIRDLKSGNRKLGILPLDPLHFTQLEIHQADGPVAINLKFLDIDISGIANLHVDSFKTDWDKYQMEAETHLEAPDVLSVHGSYNINGKVLMLPIKGAGNCNLTFENFKARILFNGKELDKDGVKHVDFTEVKVDISMSKMHVRLENLFNGDKALGDQMNIFLNENWAEILEELKPAISKAIGRAFSVVTNAVFHKIPLNELSPQ